MKNTDRHFSFPGAAQQGVGAEPCTAGTANPGGTAANQKEGAGRPRNGALGARTADYNESDAGAEQAERKIQQDPS